MHKSYTVIDMAVYRLPHICSEIRIHHTFIMICIIAVKKFAISVQNSSIFLYFKQTYILPHLGHLQYDVINTLQCTTQSLLFDSYISSEKIVIFTFVLILWNFSLVCSINHISNSII